MMMMMMFITIIMYECMFFFQKGTRLLGFAGNWGTEVSQE